MRSAAVRFGGDSRAMWRQLCFASQLAVPACIARILASANTAPTQALVNAVHLLAERLRRILFLCSDVYPVDGAGEICGRSGRDETLAVRKLRQRSSGIAATHINAS